VLLLLTLNSVTRMTLTRGNFFLVVVVWRTKIVMITEDLLASTVWLRDDRCCFVVLEYNSEQLWVMIL
jgi:hypothetical protein